MLAFLSQLQYPNSSPPSVAYMRQWISSALVQIMASRLFGAKPLSEPVLVYLSIGSLGKNFNEILTKIQNFIHENASENIVCERAAILSRPQCVNWRNTFQNPVYKMLAFLSQLQYPNSSPPSVAYMRQWISSALVQIMASRLFGAKPLSEPVLVYLSIWSLGKKLQWNFNQNTKLHSRKCIWKYRLRKGGHFVQGGNPIVFRNRSKRKQ